MLKLIYGPPGSGKTYRSDTLALEALKNNKRVVLIVPEQEAIAAENRIYDRSVDEGVVTEGLSVVSFRRLANLYFRKYGGLEHSSLGDSGRLVLLWRVVEEYLSSSLKCYTGTRDRAFYELMLTVCDELKRYCVTPAELEEASKRIPDPELQRKLSDVASIYGYFTATVVADHADSVEDVNRLANILNTHRPEPNTEFFIDSFNGFTAPEFSVIRSLIRHSPVTVTVNRFKDDGRVGFLTVEKTDQALRSIAEEVGASVEVIDRIGDDISYTKPEFKLIRDRLYDYSYTTDKNFMSDNLRLAKCRDAYSQAEYIAINICKLIRNGARYKDIAIISRNASSYEGILDEVFKKYDIPLFLSTRSPLSKTSIYRAVSSALEIITGGFRTEDILTYIKTGVLDFTLEEIDLIESYACLWNINGKRWLDGESWIMNPRGFTDENTQGISETLERINDIRHRIVDPLIELKDDISAQTVNAACIAIYNYLTKTGISEHFRSAEAKDITVYNTFIELLDTLNTVIGDYKISVSTLSSFLYLMAKHTDYGMIPPKYDCVTAGDASIIRCNGARHVFLTDCSSGSFPAAVSDDSFFTDREKKALAALRITLAPDVNERNDLESFYFLRSASEASETLTATYCLTGGEDYPSIGFQRLSALFPANKVEEYPNTRNIVDRIQTLNTSREIYSALYSTELARTIEKVYEELRIDSEFVNTPISDPDVYLSEDTTSSIFSDLINMTYSKLEKYVKCPFAYFCDNVLRLKPKKYNFFMASDMGIYIHRILELSVKKIYSKRDDNTTVSDAEIEKAVNDSAGEVLSSIVGNDRTAEGERFEALLGRLKRTVLLLVDNIAREFKQSKFTPSFFEYKIGANDKAAEPLRFKLDDGTVISVAGTVDRIDTYKNGNGVYVRVVDYKTGSVKHSIENLKIGLDAQMLIYLFAICNTKNEKFFKEFGKEDNGDILPAGVLYQPAKLTVTENETPVSSEKAIQQSDKNLVRSGVLLNDAEILKAMEADLSHSFIPVSKDSDGNIKQNDKVLVTKEGFDGLLQTIENTFKDFGAKMKNGNACASPLKTQDVNACKYCEYAPICRSKNKMTDGKDGDGDNE